MISGRGRAAQDAPRPGGAPQTAQAAGPQPGGGGRGRSRGAPPAQAQQQAPRQAPPSQPPTAQMAQMKVREQKPPAEGERRQRRRLGNYNISHKSFN